LNVVFVGELDHSTVDRHLSGTKWRSSINIAISDLSNTALWIDRR